MRERERERVSEMIECKINGEMMEREGEGMEESGERDR